MDLQIIFIIAIILFIYGIHIYFKKVVVPKIKGTFGEFKVSLKLKRLSKKKVPSKEQPFIKEWGINNSN